MTRGAKGGFRVLISTPIEADQVTTERFQSSPAYKGGRFFSRPFR